MDIQSITSSIGAYGNTGAQAAQSSSTQQAQQVKAAEQNQPQAVERKDETPRPVTNTLGQKTGTLINVTA